MASISILVLIVLLLLVKGGTVAYVSLTWSGIVILISMSFLLFRSAWVNDIDPIKINISRLSLSIKAIFQKPLSWLFLLQAWLLFQVVFGISRDLQASIDQIIIGFGFICFLCLLGAFQWRQTNVKRLILGFCILGSLQAVYGLWVFLTQKNVILWMEKVHYLDKPTGTLVNANHFAAYLSLTLLLLFAFIICQERGKNRSKQLQHSFLYFFEQFYSVYTLIIVLLMIAILATRSLGAIGSLLLTIAFAMLFAFSTREQKNISNKSLFVILFFVLILLFGVLMLSDYDVLKNEITSAAFTFERRFEISRAAFRMVMDNWLLGVGAGAFYSSFSQYRDIDVGNSFYHFAHNDYLHFWAEYGLIGVVLGLIFIVNCLRVNLIVLSQSKNVYKRGFAYASIYSSIFLALHSFVDFPLRVPAFALIYLTIIGFNVVTFHSKRYPNKA